MTRNRNQIQFECQWNEVYSTSGNLTIYIGLAGKDGRPLKDLHLIESVFVEFMTDNTHLYTSDPTNYPTYCPRFLYFCCFSLLE